MNGTASMNGIADELLVAAAAGFVALVAAGPHTRRRIVGPPRPLPQHHPQTLAPTVASSRHRSAGTVSVVAVVALAGAVLAGPLVVLGAWSIVVLIRQLRPMRTARQRRDAIERDLPPAIDLLVLSVRAGLTPQHAVGELASACHGAVGDAFAEVVRRTQRGQPFADALSALGEQLGPRAGALADVIAAGDRHGLPLGPTLDQLALEAAAARQRLDQADARRLPVKLSFPLVVCTLPSFVLLAIVPAMIAALSSLGGPAW